MRAPGTVSFPAVHLALPPWVEENVRPGDLFPDRRQRMRLAIDLAARNIAERTGGPFGAGVFERDTGRLIAAGVNVVMPASCSLAHAEAMAIILAQQSLRTHDLGRADLPPLELVSSAQPCCQCLGAVWWSGVVSLVIAARAEDVEAITGFREGPLPGDWVQQLEHRTGSPPVAVVRDVLREEALAPLRAYKDSGQPAFNPGRSPAPRS